MKTKTISNNYPPLKLSWLIWGLGASFYLIAFFQRVAPAVLTTELTADFNLSATALGNLTAFYFYSYVAMQIPTGIIADRWGPRRLLALGTLVAAVGSWIFAIAPDVFWANTGRFLIGGSVAVAFVCTLKLAYHWLPSNQISLATGTALFVGIVGAVTAGMPLRILVDIYTWRPVMLAMAGITGLVAIAIWIIVRDDPEERSYMSYASLDHASESAKTTGILNGIVRVLSRRNVQLLCFVPGGIVGSVLTFAGLWGVPFLSAHYNLEKTTAALLTSILLVSWAIGGPVFGWLSDHLGKRKPLYLLSMIVLLLAWYLVIMIPDHDLWFLITMLIVIGFFSGSMIISFAFIRESVPRHLAGTSSGLANMGVIIGPMILQPAVGWMLDRGWQGDSVDGERIYSFEVYQSGFSLFFVWLILSIILLTLSTETHCQQLDKS